MSDYKEEMKDDTHENDCLMINLPRSLSNQIVDFGYTIPSNFLFSSSEGLEYAPHITIMYGLNDVDPDELASVIDDFGEVLITLKNINAFHNDEQDVLIIEVESNDLHDLHNLIKNSFKDKINSTFSEYIPHITIAYLKPNMSSTFKFKDMFSGKYCYLDKTLYDYENEEYDISLIGGFDDLKEEETEVTRRCPKHNWVSIGKTAPYNHQGYNKHLGIKTKKVCSICGQLKWFNLRTGNTVSQIEKVTQDK